MAAYGSSIYGLDEYGGDTYLELYSLLPRILRHFDEEGSGGTVVPVLRKIVRAIELQIWSTYSDINGVLNLVDVDIVDEEYLPFLGFLNGEKAFAEWSLVKKRMFIGDLAFLYKIKAMPKSLMALLYLYGITDLRVAELYKEQLHETFSYLRDPGYVGIRAARIEYYHINEETGQEESIYPFLNHNAGISGSGISIVFDGIYAVNSVVDIEERMSQDKVDFLRRMYPIHVKERRSGYMEDGKQQITEDDLGEIQEGVFYCSCENRCETGCELMCELACEIGCESNCETGCETFCESGCETGCEVACETGCETSNEVTDVFPCGLSSRANWSEEVAFDDDSYDIGLEPLVACLGLQVYIESLCEETCEAGACQGGACEGVGCQSWCQDNCQIICNITCQIPCEATCENPCMSTVQS